MPVVPTYEDRGIRLDPGLNFRDNTKATGETFGSGIGTALGTVGKGLTDIGQAVSEAAIAREKAKAEAAKAQPDLAQVENEAAANMGLQRVAAGLVQLGNGNSETPAYGSLAGTRPVDTFLRHQEDIDKFVKETRDSLPEGAQAFFDGKAASIVYDAKTQGVEALAQARKDEIPKGYWAGASAYQDQAVEAGGDEARYQRFMASGLEEIEKLGFLQRWEPEHTEQVTAAYISDARRRSTLRITEADPIKALKYSLDYAADLSPSDKMALYDAMQPGLKAALRREAAHTSQANPASDQFAATNLPPAAYVLLGAVGQTEAPSYDAQSGGGRFGDFSKHPGMVGIGGTSTKAGRYGIDGSTWDRIVASNHFADFSPASQDRGAWWLAQQNYRTLTNRSLEEDIRIGRWAEIRKELAPTWAGLAKLSDEDFAKLAGWPAPGASQDRQTSGIGSDAAASAHAAPLPPLAPSLQPPTARFSPATEAVLSKLPPAQAEELRKAGFAGMLEAEQEKARADAVEGATRADGYQQRIDNGDKTLTPREIEEDVVLTADQKAELGAALKARNQEIVETDQNVAKFTTGELKFDSYSEANQAAVDRVWERVSTWGDTPEKVLPLLNGLIRQTGIVPSQTVREIEQGLNSKDPAAVLASFQQSQRLMTNWGDAVRRNDQGNTVANAAIDFRVLADKYGQEQAVKRYIEQSDPARRPVVDDGLMDRMLKRIVPQDITDLFMSRAGQPYLGFTPEQRGQIMADYTEGFKRAFEETGDYDRAKARAGEAFKQTYGVTYVTGHPTLMKYPPERYHGAVGGSMDWMSKRYERLIEDIRRETNDPTIQPGQIMLEPAEGTAEAVAEGKAPLYRVFLMRTGADGKVTRQEVDGGHFFGFDEAGAKADQAKIDDAEIQRLREVHVRNAQKRLEGHQDEMGLLKKAEKDTADLFNRINRPDPDRPVMGNPSGRGDFDPNGPEKRVYTAADIPIGKATLRIWQEREKARKAKVETEGRKAREAAGETNNYLYTPPKDMHLSWDKDEPPMTPEEIQQKREEIADEKNARRPIGMRALQGNISKEIENDNQLIANLDARKNVSETQSPENTAAPGLWITSYDQAETIDKEPEQKERLQIIDTSDARVALAAFRQSSPIGSMITNQTWASDDGTTDPNFDVVDELKKPENRKYWAYRDQALNIFNQATFKAWKDQIDMEEEDKQVLEAAGVKGEVFSALAELISPETFIPIGAAGGAAAKTIMAATKVVPPAVLAKAFEELGEETAKAAGREILFQLSQKTRPRSESLKAVLVDPAIEVAQGHLEDAAKKKLMENPEVKQKVKKFVDLIEQTWVNSGR